MAAKRGGLRAPGPPLDAAQIRLANQTQISNTLGLVLPTAPNWRETVLDGLSSAPLDVSVPSLVHL